MNNFLGTTVIFPVQDVATTVKYYKENLGFEVNGVWENPAYGSVKRDQVVIEFGEGRKDHAGSGVCIIHVENADHIYNELKSKNVEFVGDFSNREYGNKDFRVKDNNGNILIIGHSLKNQNELLLKNKIA